MMVQEAPQAPPSHTLTARPESQERGEREVLAEGRAALTGLDLAGARKAAIASALRSAVEKTLGVYVSSQTLTKNFALVRDQVLTQSAGHVLLKEVVRTEQLPQEIRVIVRAVVSVKPLVEQVRALGLARAWRVQTTEPTLERALSAAGFVVVPDTQDADLCLSVAPRHTLLAQIPLETAVGPMTMYSVQSEVTLRALRGSEVIAARMGTESARHIRRETAERQNVTAALTRLAPLLTDELLALPTRLTRPVQLTVQGVASATSAQSLTESLGALPSVQRALKRSWSAQTAVFELEVPTDTELARELKTLGVTVLRESKTQILGNLVTKKRP